MLTLQNALTFARGSQPEELLQNFWDPEDGFIWSKGKWCEIAFSFDANAVSIPRHLEIIVELDVFKHSKGQPGQNVFLYLNGLRIGSVYCTKKATYVFPVNGGTLNPDDNLLIFDTPNSSSPADYGSADGRVLGVQLYSLQFRAVD